VAESIYSLGTVDVQRKFECHRRATNTTMSTSDSDFISLRKHMQNSDGNWGASLFDMSYLASPIASIQFTAHSNVDNAGDEVLKLPPTNHWSLLLFPDNTTESAVHLDMTPNEPGEPGMLIIEHLPYGSELDSIHAVSCSTKATVASILQVLVNKKRDNYIFAPVGEGCRFWLSTIADDFVRSDLISSTDSEFVKQALGRYWPYPPGSESEERHMEEGTF